MNCRFHPSPAGRLLCLILSLACPAWAQEADIGALTRKIVLQPQDHQRRTSRGLTAFHDFQFRDGYPQSQITFTNHVAGDAGSEWIPTHYDHGNAVVVADVDGAGLLDIVTLEWNHHPQVLVSNLSEKKAIHYLKIKLVGTKSNRDGLGAFVEVHARGKTYTQYTDGNSRYFAQSVIPLYFGLGEATQVEKVEVRWPSGIKQTVSAGLELNRLLTIRERAD
jgi:hypothetical protein